jgi:hypothetical protein
VEKLFDENRNYVLGDPELNLLGNKEKLAYWRHRKFGPSYFSLGRKIIYTGKSLNEFCDAHRVECKVA